MWVGSDARLPRIPILGPIDNGDSPLLLYNCHQGEADWPAAAVEPPVDDRHDPLWEDARFAEKLAA